MKRPEFPASSPNPAPGSRQPVEPVSSASKAERKPRTPRRSAATVRPAAEPKVKPERTPTPRKRPVLRRPASPERLARAQIRASAKQRRAEHRLERRRFTAGRRQRRLIVLTASIAVAALFVTVFGVAYSPLMAVRAIQVVGTSTLDHVQVEQALAAELGTPLPLVNADRIAKALAAFPAVQSFSTESRPPSTLIVRIVERTPIGSLKRAAGFDLVDSAGVVLSSSPSRPAGVPRLEVDDSNSDAFHTLGVMLLTLPADLRAQVTAAGASSAVDAWFELPGGRRVVWGDASDGPLKLRVLQALLVGAPSAKKLNVSAPNSPFVR